MNLLDAFLILLILAQSMRWAALGFIFGFLSLAGLLAGLVGSLLIAPLVVSGVDNPNLQITLAVTVIVVLTVGLATLGQKLGVKLNRLGQKNKLNKADHAIGGLFGAGTALIIIWLLASVLSGLPYQNLNRQISGSWIIRQVNEALPPAPAVLDRLAEFTNPSDLPRFFAGPEPMPLDPIGEPSSEEAAIALASTKRSIVRIEGSGCGGMLTGSGFIARGNLVVTNAHVVAGIDNPIILDGEGQHRSEVIVFDPNQDIAILRPDIELSGRALGLSTKRLSRGDTGVVIGYPGGGRLDASPASVMQHLQARGRDIYGNRNVIRDIYQLHTSVEQGNSGGPMVLADGTVVAVIFGRSDAQDDIGYAMVSGVIASILDQSQNKTQPVSTGHCVR